LQAAIDQVDTLYDNLKRKLGPSVPPLPEEVRRVAGRFSGLF
jgi:hypothetical protein